MKEETGIITMGFIVGLITLCIGFAWGNWVGKNDGIAIVFAHNEKMAAECRDKGSVAYMDLQDGTVSCWKGPGR